jgi:hypothetical protein
LKTILKISVLGNLIFAGTALFLWEHPRTVTISPPVTATAVEPQTPMAPPAVQMVVAPFHWSQLMSTNGYRAFVENLRAAGCPEATVEDIVWGDTGRAYSVMRGRLRVSPSDAGPWSAQSQMQMVAYFLGQGPAPQAPAEMPPLPLLAGTPPMVLQNVDLSPLNLSEDQTQALANIRDTFWKTVSGVNQDTNDPRYLARWRKAQDAADSMFRVTLGSDYWKYQMLSSAQAGSEN